VAVCGVVLVVCLCVTCFSLQVDTLRHLIHIAFFLFTACATSLPFTSSAPLRSLLSAEGWFFVWSFVVLFLSCRVLCCVVIVVCLCVTCFSFYSLCNLLSIHRQRSSVAPLLVLSSSACVRVCVCVCVCVSSCRVLCGVVLVVCLCV